MLLQMISALLLATPMEVGDYSWSNIEPAGWTESGDAAAWIATIDSIENDTGSSAGAMRFLIVADATGRVQRVFRVSTESRSEGVRWIPRPGGRELWQRAESEQAGERWRTEHKLSAVPEGREISGETVLLGGRDRVTVRTVVSGSGCNSAALMAKYAATEAKLFDDPCHKDMEEEKQFNYEVWGTTTIRWSWSPDSTRVVVVWNVNRFCGRMGYPERTHSYITVLTKRSLAAIDLLDAGAGPATDGIAAKLGDGGFRLMHRGKAQTARQTTEIFFAPGFENDARDVARLVGAVSDAVKPLTWKTPYSITIAAGSGL